MTLLQLIAIVAGLGLVVYLVVNYIPMQPPAKQIIIVLYVIILIFIILNLFVPLADIRIGR